METLFYVFLAPDVRAPAKSSLRGASRNNGRTIGLTCWIKTPLTSTSASQRAESPRAANQDSLPPGETVSECERREGVYIQVLSHTPSSGLSATFSQREKILVSLPLGETVSPSERSEGNRFESSPHAPSSGLRPPSPGGRRPEHTLPLGETVSPSERSGSGRLSLSPELDPRTPHMPK